MIESKEIPTSNEPLQGYAYQVKLNGKCFLLPRSFGRTKTKAKKMMKAINHFAMDGRLEQFEPMELCKVEMRIVEEMQPKCNHPADIEFCPDCAPEFFEPQPVNKIQLVDLWLYRYWDLAFSEGKTGVSHGTEAQKVLSAIRAAIRAEASAQVGENLPR